MLEVTVTRKVNRPMYQVFQQTVRIGGYDKLTPAAAKAAERVAFGGNGNATVSDGTTAYRIYPNSVRKIQIDY